MDELGVESFYFLLEQFFLLPLLEKLMGSSFQGLIDHIFLLFDLLLLSLELQQLSFVNDHFVPLIQLRSQFIQLFLILSNQGLLVKIFIDGWFIFDAFCSVCKFKGGKGFEKGLGGGGDHGEHRCFAISSKAVGKKSGQD